MDLNEARAEVRSWQKDQVSRKKKRSHSGSDIDDSDSDDSGEPSWKKKKRANHKDRLKNEEEQDDVGQHLTSYRDRANERREGDTGIEDISAPTWKRRILRRSIAASGALYSSEPGAGSDFQYIRYGVRNSNHRSCHRP